MQSFSIVIVNWNTGNLLYNCIKSIYNSDRSNCILKEIVIVDNSSSDNSLDKIHTINLPIRLIKNKLNLGFSKACNQGAKDLETEFILFLNPDTIVFKDTFINLFNHIYLSKHDNVGIFGVQFINENNEIVKTCSRFPTIWNFIFLSFGLNILNSKFFKSYLMQDWSHDSTKDVDEVIGAFFFVKNKIFREVKGFDERYFLYYEELDFSKKIYDRGYRSRYLTESKAYHKGWGSSENIKAQRLFYNLQSRIIFSFKHFGFIKGLIIMIITLLIEPFTRFIFLIIKKVDKREFLDLFLAYKMLFKNSLKILLSKKR